MRSLTEWICSTLPQVVLRWHIQRFDIVFPKSVTPSRMKNFGLFDFELDPADVEEISALDRVEDAAPARTRIRSTRCLPDSESARL